MFEIKETQDPHYPHSTEISLEVRGLYALPCALKRLAEQGHNMGPSLKALQAAVEDQRKRKALEAAISDLTKPAEKAEK
jgi:hypothetical protein